MISTTQKIFDDFNGFIISDDRKVFQKLVARTLIYNKVKNITGDILECGVFKGSGLYTFLKLKEVLNPNSIKKVVGFDMFDTFQLLSTINDEVQRKTMDTLFQGRNFEHNSDYKLYLEQNLKGHGFKQTDFELVKGDISITSKKYVDDNPGLKISILYIDLDLEVPTYNTLVNLWDYVSIGGIVVFDEYAHSKWSESIGVDRFLKERGLKVKNLNFIAPTAYIIKSF